MRSITVASHQVSLIFSRHLCKVSRFSLAKSLALGTLDSRYCLKVIEKASDSAYADIGMGDKFDISLKRHKDPIVMIDWLLWILDT